MHAESVAEGVEETGEVSQDGFERALADSAADVGMSVEVARDAARREFGERLDPYFDDDDA
jgi:hypothetical protein